MAVRLSALCAGHPLAPGRYLTLISIRRWVDPRAIVRLEGLGQLKNSNDLIGTRTRDLPACSIVPQPTTLPHAPPGTPIIYLVNQRASEECVLSSILFELYTNKVLKEWKLTNTRSLQLRNKLINTIVYAVDQVLLAATEDRLQENITKLNKILNYMTWKYQPINLTLQHGEEICNMGWDSYRWE
jgi:hypothetical protein